MLGRVVRSPGEITRFLWTPPSQGEDAAAAAGLEEAEMLSAGGKVGSCRGCAPFRDPLFYLHCTQVARQGEHRSGSSKAGCRGFSNNACQSRCWGKELQGTASYWHPGVGTTLKLSDHRCYCQKFKGSSTQHQLGCRCQGAAASLSPSGCTGLRLIHKNQTLNRALARPNSKWQNLSATPQHSWFSRIGSRCYSQNVAGQRCAALPWLWYPCHVPLAPAVRVGAHSYRTTSLPAGTEHHVVDLRSDTVTRPSPEMRQAMAQAEVGDDDYGEDPTVKELQSVVADHLGKEEALFVPTATMANLIAVMCHCRRRGAQLLLGREAHIHVFEHGGVAQVAGVHSEILQDLPNGTMNLDELEHKIQQSYRSQYHPRPELICLENTHCSAGGRVLPLQYLQQMCQLAQRYGLKIHLDGARVLNAAVALGVLPNQITQHCDSVTLCLSKGVGAPAGALLAGRRDFIVEAWRARKLLGGGMRQAGVLAAAALVGLRHVEETLQRDHNNARSFAQGVYNLASPLCSVKPDTVETNIIMMTTLAPWLAPAKLCELMEAVSAEEVAITGRAVSVRLFPWGKHSLRAVWHCDVSAHDTQLAESKLRFVLNTCEQEHMRVC